MLRLTLLAVVAALLAPAARAQNHEPTTFDFGFEQRVRNENWNNITDYSDGSDDEREQIRYRTRVWMKAPVTQDIDFFVGLNQETNQRFGKVNKFDEVFVESLYLDFKKLFVKGLSLRVGRQNLMRGEGFILLDGGPWDGSRSLYFNAVDLAYTRGKSTIELIGILNPAYDRMLPRIHDQRKYLIDWDESALGAYYTHRGGYEGYYFYKKETSALRPPPSGTFQPDRHIHTAGGRIVRRLRPGLTATGEFAGQWGFERPASDIHGWGGYAYLKRSFEKTLWKPYLQAGYWGMSGDDPATATREGWDPLFSRWPKWSELYIYSHLRERGGAYWTNTSMWQAEMGVQPRKPLGLRLTYYHMGAFQRFAGNQNIFGNGTFRGNNLQARFDFAVGKHWKGHALYETHRPGDFYRAQAPGYFARFELSYTITAKVAAADVRKTFFGN